jgi:uncharacterized protein
MQQERDKFLGRGWAFPPRFRQSTSRTESTQSRQEDVATSRVEMVEAREDIEQSLQILLSTRLGERIMRPTYGCNLSDFQFEPLNATVVGFIRDMVSTAMMYHEPRIQVDRVEVNQPVERDALEGRLLISVDYIIRTTNSRFNFVYDFYLNEAISK